MVIQNSSGAPLDDGQDAIQNSQIGQYTSSQRFIRSIRRNGQSLFFETRIDETSGQSIETTFNNQPLIVKNGQVYYGDKPIQPVDTTGGIRVVQENGKVTINGQPINV